MKVKNTFVLRNVAGSNVVVPLGADMMNFNGMVTLNETGAFLWEKLKSETSVKELTEELLSEYSGITKEEAEKDVAEFIKTLDSKGIIENG